MGKKVDNAILGTRIGHSNENISEEENNVKVEGLVLSQIVYKPLEFFIPNPCNTVFDNLKTRQQLDALLKDIDEARTVLNPLITMPDGTLVEGHSRLEIAKSLEKDGRSIGRLPVRIITTPLSAEEIKQRVYLGNLSRFEIDEDTRLALYAEIWPGYFLVSGKAGRKSDHGDTISVSALSAKLGKSIPQIKRDAAILRNAMKKTNGIPSIQEIKKSRSELNEKRKLKTASKKNNVKTKKNTVDDFPGFAYLDNLKENGEWNMTLAIPTFYAYAKLISKKGYSNLGQVIEYLSERIMRAEASPAVDIQKVP